MRRVLLAALMALACNRATIDPMKLQPRLRAYGSSDYFESGRAMQSPPEGTIAREALAGDPARATGLVDGHEIDRIPIPITAQALAHGRDRYEVMCAPCHGILGDGRGPVATKMGLRNPPSLHQHPIAVRPGEPGHPPGDIFHDISVGYGLMPGYETALSPDERWAVVAYVEALQMSQRAPLAELPEAARRELPRSP